ncbi:MAG: hypothetical protein WDZ88_00415 [Candidatus Paceibacterota bacterium]
MKYIIGSIALIFVFVLGYLIGGNIAEAPTKDASSVTSFEECVEAGNPVMESYPRQCRHEGVTFVEKLTNDDLFPPDNATAVTCTPEQRDRVCTREYNPVCGLTQVECITEPCDPVPQTYGNACDACSNARVVSYVAGECSM